MASSAAQIWKKPLYKARVLLLLTILLLNKPTNLEKNSEQTNEQTQPGKRSNDITVKAITGRMILKYKSSPNLIAIGFSVSRTRKPIVLWHFLMMKIPLWIMTINVSVDSLVEMTLGCCCKCYAEGRIYFLCMDILALVNYAIDFGLNNNL